MAKAASMDGTRLTAAERPRRAGRIGSPPISTLLLWAGVTIAVAGSVGMFDDFMVTAWASFIVVSVATIARCDRVIPLAPVFLFNLLFAAYAVPHLFFDVDVVSTPITVARPFLAQFFWLNALFTGVVGLWLGTAPLAHGPLQSFRFVGRGPLYPRFDFMFWLLCASLLLLTLVAVKGQVVIGVEGGYQTYTENLAKGSGIQEYMLVPFFWSALLMRTRLQRIVWYVILALFFIKLSLIGYRIVALMGFLMGAWFIGAGLTLRKLILSFVIGYIAFSILGLLKGALQGEAILTSIFVETHGDSLVSHHGNVLWASTALLRLIDDGTIDLYRRIDLFLYYSANSLIPSAALQNALGEAYLGVWLQESGYTSGGGHIAVFSYVAAGLPGVIGIASLLGGGIRALCRTPSTPLQASAQCWVMMVLVLFPRWMSYDLGNFFLRLPIYALIGYLIYYFGSRSAAPKQEQQQCAE